MLGGSKYKSTNRKYTKLHSEQHMSVKHYRLTVKFKYTYKVITSVGVD